GSGRASRRMALAAPSQNNLRSNEADESKEKKTLEEIDSPRLQMLVLHEACSATMRVGGLPCPVLRNACYRLGNTSTGNAWRSSRASTFAAKCSRWPAPLMNARSSKTI